MEATTPKAPKKKHWGTFLLITFLLYVVFYMMPGYFVGVIKSILSLLILLFLIFWIADLVSRKKTNSKSVT